MKMFSTDKYLDAIMLDNGLNISSIAFRAAGLNQILSSFGPFTILAPTDQAFAKITDDTDKFWLDKDKLLKVMKKHIIFGKITKKDWEKLPYVENMNKEILVTSAIKIKKGNIKYVQGFIHSIDEVFT